MQAPGDWESEAIHKGKQTDTQKQDRQTPRKKTAKEKGESSKTGKKILTHSKRGTNRTEQRGRMGQGEKRRKERFGSKREREVRTERDRRTAERERQGERKGVRGRERLAEAGEGWGQRAC